MEGDSEKEPGVRGGRAGNFGIKIFGDPGTEISLLFKRGFSIMVDSEKEEKREERWEYILR